MKQHTPGPWELWTSNSWRRFGSAAGALVCEPITQNDGHPDLHFRNGGPDGPDARLIAAAPDLLAALRCFLDDPRFQVGVGGNPIAVERMIDQARAAYAKATGE